MKENSVRKDDINAGLKILDDFANLYGNTVGMTENDYKKIRFVIDNILSDYKRVLKENERYQKSDYETICLENKELKEINEKLESENQEFLYKYGNVLKENEELKDRIREHTMLISPYYVKENYIPKTKIEEILEKTDLEIKRLLESEERK